MVSVETPQSSQPGWLVMLHWTAEFVFLTDSWLIYHILATVCPSMWTSSGAYISIHFHDTALLTEIPYSIILVKEMGTEAGGLWGWLGVIGILGLWAQHNSFPHLASGWGLWMSQEYYLTWSLPEILAAWHVQSEWSHLSTQSPVWSMWIAGREDDCVKFFPNSSPLALHRSFFVFVEPWSELGWSILG